MSLYHDPNVPYMRPSLVGDLLTIPAKPSNHQLENQTTTVLAWLVDRSPAIAQVVIELFLGEYAPAPALTRARPQVSLPKPGGGALRPDLSICVADHALQLLIEVKVAAELADYDGLSQEKQYRLLWGPASPGDARVRAVGTLQRQGTPTPPDPANLVARDVTWRELRDAIAELVETGQVASDVVLVAESFVTAIDDRISPKPMTDAELDAFFDRNRSALDATREAVEQLLPRVESVKTIRGKAYVGWRLTLATDPAAPLLLRLYIAPAGTRLNLWGAPDALIAAPERDPDGLILPHESAAVQAAGFPKTKDIDSYTMHRDVWPLDRIDPVDVAVDIVDRLNKSGLLPNFPTPASGPISSTAG